MSAKESAQEAAPTLLGVVGVSPQPASPWSLLARYDSFPVPFPRAHFDGTGPTGSASMLPASDYINPQGATSSSGGGVAAGHLLQGDRRRPRSQG